MWGGMVCMFEGNYNYDFIGIQKMEGHELCCIGINYMY